MEIGHEPRSCALVGAAFNIRSTVLLSHRNLFLHYHLINPSTSCSYNSVCRTHSFKVLVSRFTHSPSRQFRCFSAYNFFNLQSYINSRCISPRTASPLSPYWGLSLPSQASAARDKRIESSNVGWILGLAQPHRVGQVILPLEQVLVHAHRAQA